MTFLDKAIISLPIHFLLLLPGFLGVAQCGPEKNQAVAYSWSHSPCGFRQHSLLWGEGSMGIAGQPGALSSFHLPEQNCPLLCHLPEDVSCQQRPHPSSLPCHHPSMVQKLCIERHCHFLDHIPIWPWCKDKSPGSPTTHLSASFP